MKERRIGEANLGKMLWHYQYAECIVHEKFKGEGTLRYWKVSIHVPLSIGMYVTEDHWVIVQPYRDSRTLIVNEMARYFGLPTFDMVLTKHLGRKYILIRSTTPDPEREPELTLRGYAMAENRKHNKTDTLCALVRQIIAFRRLMCVSGTTESSILVRIDSRTRLPMLYSYINTFDAKSGVEIELVLFQRWFVLDSGIGASSSRTLIQELEELMNIQFPQSTEGDELERWNEDISDFMDAFNRAIHRVDKECITYINDIYHYLVSAQQSPVGKARFRR